MCAGGSVLPRSGSKFTEILDRSVSGLSVPSVVGVELVTWGHPGPGSSDAPPGSAPGSSAP